MKLMTRVEEVESVPRSKGSKRPALGHGAGCSQMGTDEGLSPKICPIFGIVHGRALLKRGRYGETRTATLGKIEACGGRRDDVLRQDHMWRRRENDFGKGETTSS